VRVIPAKIIDEIKNEEMKSEDEKYEMTKKIIDERV
jgi:hypothetical protein